MTKKHAVKIILILLLANPAIVLYSQDTIRNTSETSFDFVDRKYENRKDVFRVSFYMNAEEITFWDKRYLDDHIGYGILANYEFKFAKLHSINTGVKAYLTNEKSEHLSIFTSYRFYHNLNSRVRLGKTGENFFANYFFVEPSLAITRYPYWLSAYAWDFSRGEWALTYKREVETVFDVWLGYGIQRNVFKNFDIDINVGLNLQKKDLAEYNRPYFKAQIALGYTIR